MPTKNRVNVALDEATKENLKLVCEHLRIDADGGRSQAIRWIAAEMVERLGLAKKKPTAEKKGAVKE